MDLRAIEQRLKQQSEQYRERHLSVKLSLYSGFFAFEGFVLAAATLVSARAPAIGISVMGLTFVAATILFWHYDCLLWLYDVLGHTKVPRLQDERDIDQYHADISGQYQNFSRRKNLRRWLDRALYIIAFIQMLLMGTAAYQTI